MQGYTQILPYRLLMHGRKKAGLSKGVGIEMIDPEKEGLYKFAKSVLNKEHVDYFCFWAQACSCKYPLMQGFRIYIAGRVD